jgi:hypothetical protein|tara:strand:+ start:242 stop:637 length:396 start_codon:yes stop_codon:yes gene_type:complete
MANKKVVAAQPFDVSKYQTKGQTSEMEITINEDKFTVTTRQLPWFEKSDITTKCMSFDAKSGEPELNSGLYLREVLKRIIVDAPWFTNGVTSVTDEFLSSIDGALGSALEQLVPNAFTNEMTEVEVIKKES